MNRELKSVSIAFAPSANTALQIITPGDDEYLETQIMDGWFTVRKRDYDTEEILLEYSYPTSSVLYITEEHYPPEDDREDEEDDDDEGDEKPFVRIEDDGSIHVDDTEERRPTPTSAETTSFEDYWKWKLVVPGTLTEREYRQRYKEWRKEWRTFWRQGSFWCWHDHGKSYAGIPSIPPETLEMTVSFSKGTTIKTHQETFSRSLMQCVSCGAIFDDSGGVD